MKNISMWLMGLGVALFTAGELKGACDPKPNDTASEAFKNAPKIVQFAIIFFAGATFSHFAEWKIRDAIEESK
jgi:hypothetical protein